MEQVDIKRLRWLSQVHQGVADHDGFTEDDLTRRLANAGIQAADELERLTAENAELRYNNDCSNEELGLRLEAVLGVSAERDALREALQVYVDAYGWTPLAQAAMLQAERMEVEC